MTRNDGINEGAAESPGYTIDVDPARRFARIVLIGFWDDATLARYVTAVGLLAEAGRAAHRAGGPPPRVLIDMRRHTLLAKGHAISLEGMLPPVGDKERTAILLGNAALLRMQVRRVATDRAPRFFESEAIAMDWLFSKEPG